MATINVPEVTFVLWLHHAVTFKAGSRSWIFKNICQHFNTAKTKLEIGCVRFLKGYFEIHFLKILIKDYDAFLVFVINGITILKQNYCFFNHQICLLLCLKLFNDN